MLKKILSTQNDLVILVLRLGLGIMIFPHGMQKLFGWFGGYGFSGTMDFFTNGLHIPPVFAFLAIMAEGLGSLGLLTGLLTRIAAFAVTVNMLVAVYMLHWQHGFFMNWAGNLKGEGFEFHILAVAIGIALMIRGGGALSLDGIFADKK